MSRGVLDRAVSLARVLRRDPVEFADRVSAIVEGRLASLKQPAVSYEPESWEQMAARLAVAAGPDFAPALQDPPLRRHEADMARRQANDTSHGIDSRHDGDAVLARCCYALVRALRPHTVVETGVAHGVTSAYILAAMKENGSGRLHSIDLPPHDAGAEKAVGVLVAPHLRERWTLHRGISRRLLPALLRELGGIGMFVHDSLHTYRNMHMEFDQALSVLRPGGAIVADDIEGNTAFLELRERAPSFWGTSVQASKPGLLGVMLR
jgi:predicted O-methyltransferase YrrM